MRGRKLVEDTLARKNTGPNPFWLGNPADETKILYWTNLGLSSEEMNKAKTGGVLHTQISGKHDIDLALATGSDMVWFTPEIDAFSWKHPEGKPMWDTTPGDDIQSLSQPGVFSEAESISDIEAFGWPDPDNLCLESTFGNVKAAHEKGLAVFGGMWCPFFHTVSDLFGMENYFMKMYDCPEVVLEVTERIVDFYLETNKRCLDKMSGLLSAGFFGNDLGSQRSPLISIESFKTFILPYIKKIVAQIKSYDLPVVLHCCGAISELIPFFIDAGIDALHPIQAAAVGMEPHKLQEEFGKDLVFIGGVDTQDLLPFGSVQQVDEKVKELTSIFGPNYIVSPSHEALLPNVGLEKVLAMSKAAKAILPPMSFS